MKSKLSWVKMTLVLCLLAVVFSKCKKTENQADVTYITDFYGVNKEYTSIVANPFDSSKCLKVVIKWDEKGIASYTTAIIAKVTGNASPGARVLLPPTEYNKDSVFINPTNQAVKTKCLVFGNGVFSEQTFSFVKTPICCTSFGGIPYCTLAPYWDYNLTTGWSGWSCGFNGHCTPVPCELTTSQRTSVIYYQSF